MARAEHDGSGLGSFSQKGFAMNCPSCNRSNADDLAYCDYCGTPLVSASPGKRQTAIEADPSIGPYRKRVTEFEAQPERQEPMLSARRANDPFDPFAASAPPKPKPAEARSASPVSTASKAATQYMSPSSPAVPQSAQEGTGNAVGVPTAHTGRRIIGWAVTFDEHPDGLSFVLREGRNVVGRDKESDLLLEWDQTVSGTHAFVIWRMGRARVADANTQNGTFLNEEDVLGQIEVKDGDVLRVGRTRLLIRLIEQEKANAIWNAQGSTSRSQ